ncbi:MAG: M43 family zinc metalloprotease [bacterium]|nr:M43 family zinc metalloprotease [bacterium]
MKKLFLAASLCLSVFLAEAQHITRCFTDEVYLEQVRINPEIKFEEQRASLIASMSQTNLQNGVQNKKAPIKYIPVVFHVIHKYGLENISQTQINDALRVMNEDFRKVAGTNGGTSTDALSADMEIEFRLAQFDPNGLPTNGVNRIYNLGTDNAQDPQKGLSYWDARKYFNVWVVNSIYNSTGNPGSMILGYAQFPFQINSNTSTDGIIVRADQVGLVENVDVSQAGRTVTHEAGHWVGLYHPFQNGCVGGSASNCATQGDQVCDTPPVSTATTGCPTSRNSCTNDVPDLPDLVKNYMDYANGNCVNMYTTGQKARVNAILPSYRANIYSTSNLSNIGMNADGSYKTLTASAVKAPYSYNFNSGSIAGSGWNLENYMSPGDSGWQVNASVGASGNGCLASMNLKNWRTNIRNAFTTPNIDISSLSSPTLSFYEAYAKRSSASGDRIKIFISNSYGRSEILIKTILSTELATGGVSTSSFVPDGNQWKRFTVDLTPYKSYTNCKIRFELQSLRGNNIYFDDFSISEPTSVNEWLKSEMNFSVFPNPSSDISTIIFQNPVKQSIEITLIDLQGKKCMDVVSGEFGEGNQSAVIDVNSLESGIYLVQVKTNRGAFVHKLMVD